MSLPAEPGWPEDGRAGPPVPLARWADRELRKLAALPGCARLGSLDGLTLLAERGANNGYTINGTTSAGLGGSRLLRTRDGRWFCLSLIRDADRDLVPALFGTDAVDPRDWDALAREAGLNRGADLLAQGRALGLPVALADETPASPAVEILARGPRRERDGKHRPLVVDLSAIWAGPLAGHLLWQAGMDVVRVESPARPDQIRQDDPVTFALINQGKANVALDLREAAQRDALVALVRRADVVIESSRVRALRHLGIDAEALVAEVAGLVWLSVTGHGAHGEAAGWVGIGNDCAVAGGAARALEAACGKIGFVGDALADPLTGIVGAREVLRALGEGEARRIGLSMSAIVAMALAEERAFDAAALDAELRAWGEATGAPFPLVPRRKMQAEVRAIGADTDRLLAALAQC